MAVIKGAARLRLAALSNPSGRVRRAQPGEQPLPPDAGVTLVELIVTVAIMGVAFATLIGGFFTMTVVTASNRDQVAGQSDAKQYMELIESEPFVNCPATYSVASLPTPTGWAAPTVTIAYWDPAAASADVSNPLGAFVAGCPSGTAVQRVRITMTTTDGLTSVRLEAVKRPW